MRESRTQESKKFEKFFEIVREEAAALDSIFFIDCGEGRELVTEDLEMEDLSGWLIPRERADAFEEKFRKNEVSNRWDSFVRFAVWEQHGDMITIEFKEF
jgi:hypothetical protein|nr:MAG TPA: hypothetical protein [Caudoviricetes sp.]